MADPHSADSAHGAAPAHRPLYFVPAPSQWPAVGGIAMILTMFGAAMVVNHNSLGWFSLAIGLGTLTYMLVGWFSIVSRESEHGDYNHKVDISFRWGMSWFIFSEVMFFAAFFGALFYARVYQCADAGDFDHQLLWPDFVATWPHAGPAGTVDPFETMGPFWLPTINTALLLSSGVTLTIAHHALRADHRSRTIVWLAITVLLGVIIPRRADLRVRSCVPRSELAADVGDLRLDVLHAYRLPRLPCVCGRVDAVGRAAAPDSRAFQAGAAFRIRGGCLVLALR